MSSTTQQGLLEELEGLSVAGRNKRVAQLGRDPQHHEAIRGWYENGGASHYHRDLVVRAVSAAPAGSKLADIAFVRQIADSDENKHIRRRARSSLARLILQQNQQQGQTSDEEATVGSIIELVKSCRSQSHRTAVLKVVRKRSAAVADRVIASFDAAQQAKLLPSVSAAFIQAHQDRLFFPSSSSSSSSSSASSSSSSLAFTVTSSNSSITSTSSSSSSLITCRNISMVSKRHGSVLAASMLSYARGGMGAEYGQAMWQLFLLASGVLSGSCPDQALELLAVLLPHRTAQHPLTRRHALPLMRARPDAYVRLLLTGDNPALPFFFDRTALASLDTALFRQLCARRAISTLNSAMTPHQRQEAFTILYSSSSSTHNDNNQSQSQQPQIDLLPSDLRVAEARRVVALPEWSNGTSPSVCASYLPWDEAKAYLEPYITDADPDTRAHALGLLLAVAVYDSDGSSLDRALELIARREREQDAVRNALLQALTRVPPTRWHQQRRLDALAQILQHTRAAVDCSPATLTAAITVVVNLAHVKHHDQEQQHYIDDFARRWLQQLWMVAAQSGGPWLAPNTERKLHKLTAYIDSEAISLDSDPHIISLWLGMVDTILLSSSSSSSSSSSNASEASTTSTSTSPVIAKVEALTRHEDKDVSATAINILLQAATYDGRHALVTSLLAEEPSVILVVRDWCMQHRQDLLTPAMLETSDDDVDGKFAGASNNQHRRRRYNNSNNSSNNTCGYDRLTPAQQGAIARRLNKELEDLCGSEYVSTYEVYPIMRALPLLQSVPTEQHPLFHASRADNDKAAVRTMALSALGRLQTRAAREYLEACMGNDDPRAEDAIGPLTRQLGNVEHAAVAVDALKRIAEGNDKVMKKVAFTKTLVRSLGQQGQAGVARLLELERQDQQRRQQGEEGSKMHTDVRAALVATLMEGHLTNDAAFSVVLRQSQSYGPEDRAPAALLAKTSFSDMTSEQAARGVQILANLLRHPNLPVRLQALQTCASVQVVDSRSLLLDRLVELITTSSSHQSEVTAAAAVFFGKYALRDLDRCTAAVRALLPRRRALQEAIAALNGLSASGCFPRVAEAVVNALAPDAATGHLQLRLALQSNDAQLIAGTVHRLQQAAALTVDAAQVFIGGVASTPLVTTQKLEAALTSSEDARVRRLGLAAFTANTTRLGWSHEARQRLLAFQQDPSLEVAGPAAFIFPPTTE